MKTGASLSVFKFPTGPLQTNAYVLVEERSDSAVVVDPGYDDGTLVKFIDKRSLKIEKILLTHGHFDHIGAVPELKLKTKAEVWIHPFDADMLIDPSKNLSAYVNVHFSMQPADGLFKDGMSIRLGSSEIRVIHTPGHSPGSVCFYCDGFLIAGDTLFRDSIGRTDFPGSSTERLIQSIRCKILPLGDKTIVHPGHGDDTTLAHEKRNNPFLREGIFGV